MTAGEAIRMADELRPNNSFSDEMKQLWLRQADSGLRRNVVERSDTGSDFEGRGADILWEEGLEYETPLLADGAAEVSTPTGWRRRWTSPSARQPGRRTNCSSTRAMCRSLRRG